MSLNLPPRGFSFPHTGNGDATTVAVLHGSVYVQIDLNHVQGAESADDGRAPVIDDLIEALPSMDGRPYLSLFVLTHPDQDHCRGFARLLDEVTIGEIIHTPRIFREYEEREDGTLCADAQAFRDEAHRRRKAAVAAGGDPGPGDRVRIVGYDELFQEDAYKHFPTCFRHSAGSLITEVDGRDVSGVYEMFVHGPLRGEHGGARNDSSFAFQLVLTSDGGVPAKALFWGDRTADKIWSVVEQTRAHGNEERLEWHVMLASHHCSKYALFVKDEAGEVQPHDGVIGALEAGALRHDGAWVIASCKAVMDDGASAFTDGAGDLPPHSKARGRYESMVGENARFVCTGEHPTTAAPEPIVLEVTDAGVQLVAAPEPRTDPAPSKVAPSKAAAAWGAAVVVSTPSAPRRTIDHGGDE